MSCALLIATPSGCWAGDLSQRTLNAFDRFVREKEAEQSARTSGARHFLWAEESSERLRRVRQGEVLAEPASGKGVLKVPDGLIVDWVGAVFIPDVSLENTLALLHDYDNQKNIFKPDLVESKLLSHDGNHYRTFVRIRKKTIITLVFDAEYDVRYSEVDPTRWASRSYSVRINDVENAGTPEERELPDGRGVLRRLYTYSRYEERDGGVYIECEVVSLGRPLPGGVGWLLEPMVRNICRSSLMQVLVTTRRAVLRYDQDTRRAALKAPSDLAGGR